MKRQKIRKLLLISALLLFPITIYYFSPALIIQGAYEGIITGSFIVFIAMFIIAIFFGRIFCGYLCPAGALQECAMPINDKPPKQGWKNFIKYIIWTAWIALVVLSFIFHKNSLSVNIFYQTDHGISISDIYGYIIYYGIILLVLIPSIVFGKRTFCHYFCWMAPFMILGSRLGRLLHIKRLELKAEKGNCAGCNACNKACPMSLKVSEKIQRDKMYDDECILCGACADQCPKKAITYKFNKRGK